MRGDILIIPPDRLMERHQLNAPPTFAQLQQWVGGLIQVVPNWNMAYVDGRFVPAIVLANEEGQMLRLPENFWASAAYTTILLSKGMKRTTPMILYGTVVVASGDEDFLFSLL